MNLIFAKWIFTSFVYLNAGTGIEMDSLTQVSTPTPAIYSIRAADAGAPSGISQQFCIIEPGAYTIDLHVGMVNPPGGSSDVTGAIWLVPAGQPSGQVDSFLLFNFRSSVGTRPAYASSVTIAVEYPACYTLRYDSTGPATINRDQRVTFLTIHRSAEPIVPAAGTAWVSSTSR